MAETLDTTSIRLGYSTPSSAESRAAFDRWLAAHDREIVADTARAIVARVRSNCTPDSEAYAKGGDYLIAAVADWIESPPEWVNASWVAPASMDNRPEES